MNQYLIPEQIERHSPQPLYTQIYEQLKRELVLGGYQAGSRFYSYRKLRSIYNAELRTIAAAVELLIGDGLLEKRGTSGIYVRNKKKFSGVGNVWFAVITRQNYHPFFFNILIGLVNECEKYGLRVVVRFGEKREDFLRWFVPRPGEGLIITGDLDEELLREAGSKCNNNVVAVGNYDWQNPGEFGNVASDYQDRIREALKLASARGCRRFALITGSGKFLISRDLRSILSEFQESKQVDCKAVEELSENGYEAMGMLEDFHPDCILTTEPAFTGVWEYMTARHLKCPEDIFLIRYGKEARDNSLAGRAAVDIECCSEKHGIAALKMLLKNSKEIERIDLRLIRND